MRPQQLIQRWRLLALAKPLTSSPEARLPLNSECL